ncbi:hypothetical protein KY313_01560 [Candidatus Woesearchaeota archaeon]|jgi:predicted nucleic acid-binding protein|nr:hypothetical protein [Candidatus Woesearchaeota archaeon]
MKILFFDAGPVISMTMNHILWLLKPLKRQFKGKFFITEFVKNELVDKPLKTKRFKLEAIQTLQQINSKVLEVKVVSNIKEKTKELLTIANRCFAYNGNYVTIVHYGEIETLAAALTLNAEAIAIDEKTTRLLIEDPERLEKNLSHRMHRKIIMNNENINLFSEAVRGIKLIRSTELVTVAFELGLLNNYLPNIPDSKKELLDALLWGLKLEGCAISEKEIRLIIKLGKSKLK